MEADGKWYIGPANDHVVNFLKLNIDSSIPPYAATEHVQLMLWLMIVIVNIYIIT